MKSNGKHEVIARIAGLGLVLATVLAVVLASSIAGRAQSGATSRAVPTAAPAKTAPAAPAGQPATASERQPKGAHEGIKVHGHWTIEVRNPDGKLVSHTEFENALVQPQGAQALVDMLLGYAVPGGYEILLSNGTGALNGPCTPITLVPITSCHLVGSLITPEPANFGDLGSECGGTGFTNQMYASDQMHV
jgi:hypothetical protein